MQCKDVVRVVLMIGLEGMISLFFHLLVHFKIMGFYNRWFEHMLMIIYETAARTINSSPVHPSVLGSSG